MMRNVSLAGALAVVVAATTGATMVAGAAGDDVRPLPREDQKLLEQYLGKGVVGEAVAASPISDPSAYYPLRAASRSYRLTSGKNKGSMERHVLTELKRNEPGSSWREAWGESNALFLHRADDGSIMLVTHNEQKEGMINQYAPPEPMVLKDLNPGESRKSKSALKVYDISHPDHLSHEGQLDLTFTYVGAYRVTVPAGSYEAALLKWEYTGKVGPAKVNDVQYRLLAKGTGTVAMIEKKKVSAMLVYNDKSKIGKVLVSEK